MSAQGGGDIQTSDLHFMRHDPQPIELLLENNNPSLNCGKKKKEPKIGRPRIGDR